MFFTYAFVACSVKPILKTGLCKDLHKIRKLTTIIRCVSFEY